MNKQLTFKSTKQTSYLANNIAREYNNRGFASAYKIQTILNDFKQDLGITTLKSLDNETVKEYVESLKESVENGEITGKTATTYISALNTIVDYTNFVRNTEIDNISAAEHGIFKDTPLENKAVDIEQHNNFQEYLSEKFNKTQDNKFEQLRFAVELQNQFGLRFRESIGTNINTIKEGLESGKLRLDRSDWTKNARERDVEIRTEQQRELLQKVQNFMSQQGIINLAGEKENPLNYNSIKNFSSFAYNQSNSQNFHFHSERHAWAQAQYSSLWQEKTGVELQAPIQLQDKSSWLEYAQERLPEHTTQEIKELDKEIRMEISQELGHGRIDVTNVYLG